MVDPRQTLLEEALRPADPNVTEVEAPRLTKQTRAVWERLKQGPASNTELAAIAFRYGARIFDLREAGIAVETYDRDRATGVCWYRLGASCA